MQPTHLLHLLVGITYEKLFFGVFSIWRLHKVEKTLLYFSSREKHRGVAKQVNEKRSEQIRGHGVCTGSRRSNIQGTLAGVVQNVGRNDQAIRVAAVKLLGSFIGFELQTVETTFFAEGMNGEDERVAFLLVLVQTNLTIIAANLGRFFGFQVFVQVPPAELASVLAVLSGALRFIDAVVFRS